MTVRRQIAVAIGVVLALTAIASAVGLLTPSPKAASDMIAANSLDNVVFSFRNTELQMVTITGVSSAGSGDCAAQTLAPLDSSITLPHALAVGEMMQFVGKTTGYATPTDIETGVHDCAWTLSYKESTGMTGGNTYGSTGETVEFTVALGSPDTVDAQPTTMDFGSQSTFEDQVALVTNQSASTIANIGAEITGDTSHSITFEAPAACVGLTTCDQAGIDLPVHGVAAFTIRCSPQALGSLSAMLHFDEIAEVDLGTISITCSGLVSSGLAITPREIDISDGDVATAMVIANGTSTTTRAMTATITDTNNEFAFTGTPSCSGSACTFPGGEALPATLKITCTPQPMMTTGTLTVTGTNPSDHDTAIVTCFPAGEAPAIAVSPPAIDISDAVATGATSAPQLLTISNTGTAPLANVRISIASGEWTADACVTADCTIAAGGSQPVHVTFAPMSSGSHVSSLQIASNDPKTPTLAVALSASGDGDTPPPQGSNGPGVADLYACDAGATTWPSPARTWPLVCALAFALRPRRRR